ncbi:MAG: DUF4177 domain-containing protein [Clostridium sp.]|uniref:DUF4177 domain-containing protein n=1 Tax=Clostridium sp. TaxID=1506 RepID=UPI0029154662|nr:DUF4177 domain-containing protein [Clostridium sp.]MDU5111099.1 DUF4177 domain-containing protein [Clostridium sp.]
MGYKYSFVEAKINGFFSATNHRELINQYAKEGWQFINSIPTSFYGNNGEPKTFDLIFKKMMINN